MIPRLYRIIIPVTDIGNAAHFYSKLLSMEGERVSPGRHYFNLSGTILALYDPLADGDDTADWKHHPNQYIYISVEDVDAIFHRAKASVGKLISDSVETKPWGERLFYARDPFGTPICFVDSTTLFLGGSN